MMHKSHSSQLDRRALPGPQPPTCRSTKVRDLGCVHRVARVVSLKEAHLVTVIPMRRQPFVEAYGEMMSPDESEWVGSFKFGFVLSTGDLWRLVLRAPLSRQSHWRWMMSVVIDRNYFRMFLTAWGDDIVVTVWWLTRLPASFL